MSIFHEALESFKVTSRLIDEGENEAFLVMPFFFYGERESVTLRYYEQDGNYYITDDGAAANYLDNGIVGIDGYRDQVDRIKKKFSMRETESHAFTFELPDETPRSVQIFTGLFIQAISLIAYLKILS